MNTLYKLFIIGCICSFANSVMGFYFDDINAGLGWLSAFTADILLVILISKLKEERSTPLKTRLLKRLRREAAEKITVIQTQMRDCGCGQDVFEVYYFRPMRLLTRDAANRVCRSCRRDYILRCVAELKGKKK